MALPTAATPGYALYKNRVACVCLAEWLVWLERMAIKRGLIKQSLDIIQLTGSASASAGTHGKGGTFDVKQTGAAFVALCREMGAPATWSRYNMPIGSNPNHHTHGVLNGCPHNSPARYQLAAQFLRRDGLGFMGMQGADPYPAVWPRRTWQEGIDWAKAQLAPKPPAAPAKTGTSTANIAVTLDKPIHLAALQQGRSGTDVSRYQAALWNRLPGAVRQEFITRYGLSRTDLYDGVYGIVTAAMTARLYVLIRLPSATTPGPKMMRHLGFTDVR